MVAWMNLPSAGPSTGTDAGEAPSGDANETLSLVYPAGIPDTTAHYRDRAEAWSAVWDRRADVRVRPDTQVQRADLRNGRGMVAGTPSSPLVSALLTERGLTVRDDGAFVVHGRAYSDPTDVLLLDVPTADSSSSGWGPALHVAAGQTHAAALAYAFAGPFLLSGLRADYKILRDGQLIAYGTLSDTPARTVEGCILPEASARHVDLRRAPPDLEAGPFRFFAHGAVDPSSVQTFARSRTSALRAVRSTSDIPSASETIDYHLFPTHADVRYFRATVSPVGSDVRAWLRSDGFRDLATPAQGVRVDSATGDVAAVLDGAPGPVPPTEAQRWMQTARSPSDSRIHSWRALLDVGHVARASNAWHGRPGDAWTARLHAAGAVPSLDALARDTTLVHDSPYAQMPVAGTLVAFLRDHSPALLHASRRPSTSKLQRLAPAWQRHLDSVRTSYSGPDAGPDAPQPALPSDLYGANVAFASGSYATPSGYASRRGDATLAALEHVGATAASIVPYTDMPDPHAPGALLRRRHHDEAESDATVVHAIRRAHDLGMNVMLKPQISGGVEWPGAVEMPSEAAWTAFFDRYTDWMLHYALMAEVHDVEVLCIGTELVAATRNHEAEWRRLIERVRAVYGGAVVYAANWGDEAERLSFGDALDAVGVDAYYPLSADPTATDAGLRAGAREVAQRLRSIAERTERPVLVTEMGFPSKPAPWTQPHRKQEDAPERPQHQARAARALAAALSDVPVRGAFWWRWPPACRFGYGPFAPKAPTRAVLRDWFQRAASESAATSAVSERAASSQPCTTSR